MVFSDDNPVLREGLRQIVTVYMSIYFLYCFVILGPVSCLQQSRQESSLFWYTSNLHTNGSYREGTRRILITLLKPILSISWSHRVVVLSTHSGYFKLLFSFGGWSSNFHLETWKLKWGKNETLERFSPSIYKIYYISTAKSWFRGSSFRELGSSGKNGSSVMWFANLWHEKPLLHRKTGNLDLEIRWLGGGFTEVLGMWAVLNRIFLEHVRDKKMDKHGKLKWPDQKTQPGLLILHLRVKISWKHVFYTVNIYIYMNNEIRWVSERRFS